MDAGKLFLIGCMVVLAIKELLERFAARNPEAVEGVKKKAEGKAIDVINRILK
jgi:hypothetical protein